MTNLTGDLYTKVELDLIEAAGKKQAQDALYLIEHFGLMGEHPTFPVSEWKKDVRRDDTRLGYWEWVSNFGPAAALHSCDICDGLFVEEDMSSLGGDVWRSGYAPQAYPSECNGCRADYEAKHGWV